MRSSIFRIIPTHSVASWISEVLTSSGCTIFSAHISQMVPLRTLIPPAYSPWLWRFRSSVTMLMGLMPEFSASVYGMISNACRQCGQSSVRIYRYILLGKVEATRQLLLRRLLHNRTALLSEISPTESIARHTPPQAPHPRRS